MLHTAVSFSGVTGYCCAHTDGYFPHPTFSPASGVWTTKQSTDLWITDLFYSSRQMRESSSALGARSANSRLHI